MRSFTLDSHGPIHLVDFGGSGQVMLLVHGLAGSHMNWLSVSGPLAREHHVFAVDLPGFGHSPQAGRRATIAANLAVLDDVIGQVATGPVILMGNSMGGLLSLGVAAERPSKVEALILVNPALPLPRAERWRWDPFVRSFILASLLPRRGARLLRRRARALGAERLVRDVLALCTSDVRRIDPEVIDAHVSLAAAHMDDPDWHVAFHDAARSLVRTLAIRRELERWVASVTAPTLLLHGRRDRVVSYRSSRAIADLRPDWEFHLFEGVGHVPMLEAPREFLAVVEPWLRRLRGNSKPPPWITTIAAAAVAGGD